MTITQTRKFLFISTPGAGLQSFRKQGYYHFPNATTDREAPTIDEIDRIVARKLDEDVLLQIAKALDPTGNIRLGHLPCEGTIKHVYDLLNLLQRGKEFFSSDVMDAFATFWADPVIKEMYCGNAGNGAEKGDGLGTQQQISKNQKNQKNGISTEIGLYDSWAHLFDRFEAFNGTEYTPTDQDQLYIRWGLRYDPKMACPYGFQYKGTAWTDFDERDWYSGAGNSGSMGNSKNKTGNSAGNSKNKTGNSAGNSTSSTTASNFPHCLVYILPISSYVGTHYDPTAKGFWTAIGELVEWDDDKPPVQSKRVGGNFYEVVPKEVPMFIILNKYDLFQQQINKIPFSSRVPEYYGSDSNADDICQWVIDLIRGRCTSGRELIFLKNDSTNAENSIQTWEAILDHFDNHDDGDF